MQRTSHGENEGSPLILVFDGRLKVRRTAVVALLLASTGCGRGELFVTKKGKITGRVETADNRLGVQCEVTHALFGEEEGVPIRVRSGEDATRVVSVATQLRPPVPFKPRVALLARCPGYEPATSPATEIEIGYLTTPETRAMSRRLLKVSGGH